MTPCIPGVTIADTFVFGVSEVERLRTQYIDVVSTNPPLTTNAGMAKPVNVVERPYWSS